VILVHHTGVVTAIEAVMAVCAAVCSPVRMKAGCWASGPEDPRPKILGHIGRGARRMTRGGGRVSLRRSVQAVSGFVIRQRPRVGSRAVIPMPSLICSPLSEDAPLWPLQREDGQCLIHIEAAVLDRLRAMRKLGERYSV
jgi:hypothetical protein